MATGCWQQGLVKVFAAGGNGVVDLIDTPCMIENFLRNGGGEDPYRHDSNCGNEAVTCTVFKGDKGDKKHPAGWLSNKTMEVINQNSCGGVSNVGNLGSGNQVINLVKVSVMTTKSQGDHKAHQYIRVPKTLLMSHPALGKSMLRLEPVLDSGWWLVAKLRQTFCQNRVSR